MKINHCPCCKVCENCPGFQKVLDVRDAGFVLYRHTTFVEDIDKKTGATKITTNTLDDVFILENTQEVPLGKVDFTTELDRNQISCPRCVNIIKHAQRLLRNQELGASDLIGVCEHCRQKSLGERQCLKCNDIVEKFQLSKNASKKSRNQQVKTWLSKIQGLIRKALAEDKKRGQSRQLSRSYSDIDLNRILRKISYTEREPEIEDLFLPDMREISSAMVGPLSERSNYREVKKGKEVMFQITQTSYEDRQNKYFPTRGITFEKEREVVVPVLENTYKNDILLQSNTTLTENEIENEFVRRYGKSYKVQTENNIVYDYITTTNKNRKETSKDTGLERYSGLQEKQIANDINHNDARMSDSAEENIDILAPTNYHDTYKKEFQLADKQYKYEKQKKILSEGETLKEGRMKIEPTTEGKHYDSERNKNFMVEADFIDDRRKKVTEDDSEAFPRVNEHYEIDRKKYLLEPDTISGNVRRKEFVSRERKNDFSEADTNFDEIRKSGSISASSKDYDTDRKKELSKPDSVSDKRPTYDRRSKEPVPTTGKYNDSDRMKDLPKSDSVFDNVQRKEIDPDASKYHDRDRKKDILKADSATDDLRKRKSVPAAGKYYARDKTEVLSKADTVSDESKRKQLVPTASQYHDSDRRKESPKANSVTDHRKTTDSDGITGEYYDSDNNKDLPNADTVATDRKRRKSIPVASKYYDSEKNKGLSKVDSVSDNRRRKESVPAVSKYYDNAKKKDLSKVDSVSDGRRRKDSVPTASKYYDSDIKKNFTKVDSVSDDRRRKDSVPTASKYYDSDIKKNVINVDSVDDDRQKRESTAASKYYDSDRKKDLSKIDSVPDDKRRRESIPAPSKYYTSDKKGDILKSDIVSDDRKRREIIPTDIKYDSDQNKDSPKVDIVSDDLRRKEVGKYNDSDRKKNLLGAEMISEDKSRKEYISGAEKYVGDGRRIPSERRGKEYVPTADINYEDERKRELMAKAGIRHKEDEKALTRDNVPYTDDAKRKTNISTEITQYDNETRKRIPLAPKHSEEERRQGFISRIGKSFEDNLVKNQRRKDFIDIDKDNVSPIGIDYKTLKKIFIPLAVQRYTQNVSTLLQPILGLDKKSEKISKKSKIIFESPSRIRKYRSEESLLTGITKVTDEGPLGFDYIFPKVEGESKRKIRRVKSVSSSELIKDTIDKLKLKAEEEKKQREEAERLKEERRKQLETERKERELAKKIAKDLEKQLKEREKEMELELKRQAESMQKEPENEEVTKELEVKDILKEKIEKNPTEQKRKDKSKLIPDPISVKEAAKIKELKSTDKAKEVKSIDIQGKERGKEIKTSESKPKETENKQKKKEEKEKAVKIQKEYEGEKQTKNAALNKEKLKPSREVERETNKHSENDEREKLMNELKQQKEEERRKKADEAKTKKENTKEIADQPREKSAKKKETAKTEDVSENNMAQKTQETTVASDKKMTMNKFKKKTLSIYDLVVEKDRPKERRKIKDEGAMMLNMNVKKRIIKESSCDVRNLSDSELDLQSLLRKKQEEIDMKKKAKEIVVGENIYKYVSRDTTKAKDGKYIDFISHGRDETKTKDEKVGDFVSGGNDMETKRGKMGEGRAIIFEKHYEQNFGDETGKILVNLKPEPKHVPELEPESKPTKNPKGEKDIIDPEYGKGVVRYALSDRSFIEKGWTMLPTEKVVRKMNVYRMRPSHPEFDWFERNKNKGVLEYDSGEKLAQFDENGRGRLYYKNGNLALDYYNAEEVNAQQRFVVYSSGEPDERGRTQPRTVLATFDYLGNGIVFDHAGKIRLKYNQTEGVILDRSLGPVSHWKWHTLNDPPVLQQVMIDTQMAHKDPHILKLGGPAENKPRPDDEEMLAIEFDNFIKEKSAKLSQTFKPFQIKMKALKINEYFSLRVMDQATVYLIYRDGSKNIKLNIGMILDHKEIVDTDTAEVGEVSNNLERLPARTDSLAELQRNVANAQKVERSRSERDRRIRRPEPKLSVDRLAAAASRPLKPPLRTVDSTSTVAPHKQYCKCRKPTSCNVYYDTSLI